MADRLAQAEWQMDCIVSRLSAMEADSVGAGLARVSEQSERWEKQFPKGSTVRLNEQGAARHKVVGHNGNMVQTTGGDFHATKLVRA